MIAITSTDSVVVIDASLQKAHDLDTELSQGRQNGLNCIHVMAGASISEAPGFWGPLKWVVELMILGPTVTIKLTAKMTEDHLRRTEDKMN